MEKCVAQLVLYGKGAFYVSVKAEVTSKIINSCDAISSPSSQIIWPNTDDDTCSFSTPGCTDDKGVLVMRCCKDGYFSNITCKRNLTIPNPRCLGYMNSTINQQSLDFCYELKYSTTYPFKCNSSTWLNMEVNFTLLTQIGGPDTGIWVPIRRFGNTLRYTTSNEFYMIEYGKSSANNENACTIIVNETTKSVSCEEKHLGICLEYPYIIYNFTSTDLDELLSVVRQIYKESVHRHFIYCFRSISPDYEYERFEANGIDFYHFSGKSGKVWCDAFNYDFGIIKSNVVLFGLQNASYVSDFTITFDDISIAEAWEIFGRILRDAVKYNNTLNYLDKKQKIKEKSVGARVYWFISEPSQTIDGIEIEYANMQIFLKNLSSKTDLIGLVMDSMLHTRYCLKTITTLVNDFSFIWNTTLRNEKAYSIPDCVNSKSNVSLARVCEGSVTSGVHWRSVRQCKFSPNLTYILQNMTYFENSDGSYILNNVNILIAGMYTEFNASDILYVVKILLRLELEDNNQKFSTNLFLLVDNLGLIDRNTLKESQKEYRATDKILEILDSAYPMSETLEISGRRYNNILFDSKNCNRLSGILLDSFENMQEILPLTSVQEIDISSVEAVIFFYDKNLFSVYPTIALSLFFNDYLFNSYWNPINATIIFKFYYPNDTSLYIGKTFLMMKENDREQLCACWKIEMETNLFFQDRWKPAVIFKIGTSYVCVFNSFSYCAIYNKVPGEVKNGYISKFLVFYSGLSINPLYHLVPLLYDILESYAITIPGLTYEVDLKLQEDIEIIHMIVHWILPDPAEYIPDIEKEFKEMVVFAKNIRPFEQNTIINHISNIYTRHNKFCMKEETRKSGSILIWPTTPLGQWAILSLPNISKGEPNISCKICSGNSSLGAYWATDDCSMLFNVTQVFNNYCTSQFSVSEALNNFEYLQEQCHLNESSANEALDNLNFITEEMSNNFDSYDIALVAIIFQLISTISNVNISTLSSVVNNLQMVDAEVLKESQEKYNATDNILYSLDQIFLKTKFENYSTDTFYVMEMNLTRHIGIVVKAAGTYYQVMKVKNETEIDKLSTYDDFEAAVVFQTTSSNRNMSTIISIFFEQVFFNEKIGDDDVSMIFGILFPDLQRNTFPGQIKVVYNKYFYSSRGCAYWLYGIQNGKPIFGEWFNESMSHENLKLLTCYYNHTTHFAMLIDNVGEISHLLDMITSIGCSLSVIGVFGILITGLIFEKWRKKLGNVLLLNFMFTIVIQIALFYFSTFIHETIANSDSCIIVGALLHYSVVSEFCWMLIIAILQFKRFVQVLTSPPKFIVLKSFLVGWVIPAIPVALILFIDPDNYTVSSTGLCYPSGEGLYLGVVLPTSIIILINFIIFIYILFNIFRRKTECVDTVSNEIIFQWRLAILLFFMLGLTWSFAIIGEFILQDFFYISSASQLLLKVS
ncbi:hypothetical protein HHI36_003193 [Cryptolaemus montrouzieri]|uniref:G-protein coupled receptors family 2 profile 2 domain-containing protein n=1 Tax=Cryptolaemus montrouzieri TaxID=559131 RepID=A0ABD2PD97_9CUCU